MLNEKEFKIFIIIGMFLIFFGGNYLFDYIIRPNNISAIRNASVALGVSAGIGIVWIRSDKQHDKSNKDNKEIHNGHKKIKGCK